MESQTNSSSSPMDSTGTTTADRIESHPASKMMSHTNKEEEVESLNNITTDTSVMNMSTDSTLSNNSLPVVVPSSSNAGTDIDPDIDIAAEQIVHDFTEHLNQRVFPASVVSEALTIDDEDDDGVPVVGVMSTSLAAGGFEELIVGLDSNQNSIDNNNNNNNETNMTSATSNTNTNMEDSNAYVVEGVDIDDDDDDDDEEVEEVMDSSYEEEILDEEITEVEFMDDVDIEEIMEESGIIIAEDKKQLQVDNDHTNNYRSNDNNKDDIQELTRDESIHGVAVPVLHPEPSTHTMRSVDTMNTGFGGTGTVSTFDTGADTSAGNSSSTGNDDSLAVSESSHNTSVSELLHNQKQQQQQQPLYGDALLGDMSEMTMGTRSDANFDSGPVRAGNSLLFKQQQQRDDDDDDDDDTFIIDSKKNGDDYPMASAATLTAAVAAAAAEAAIHGDPMLKSGNKSISSGITARSDNSSTFNDLNNRPLTNKGSVPPALQTMNKSSPAEERNSNGKGSMNQMSVPPALQKTPSTSVRPAEMSNVPNNNEVPVPPALNGPPSQSFDNKNDIEMGGNSRKKCDRRSSSKKGPEMALQSSYNSKDKGNKSEDNNTDETKKNDGNATNDDDDDEDEISEGMNLSIYASIVLCLAVIFTVVMLSVFLSRKNKNDRDVIIPSPAPIFVTTVVPTATPISVTISPPTSSSEPPTMLGAWTISIEPVLGAAGSSFGASIVMDDNNVWSVGAPQMINPDTGVDSGGVVSATFIEEKWVLLPQLFGEQSGDMFGVAIDMSFNHLIVGAPMSLIPETTTPAGAAYYYAYDSNSSYTLPYTFRSADDLLSANGEFGHAVAIGLTGDSNNLPRVVIGAPKYNMALDTYENGRVYTYSASSTDTTWSTMEANPIIGKNAFDWFGNSVDMTLDGLRFIVGAPGSNASGYFQIYEWDGTQWNLDFEDNGNPGEAFGSDVTVLSKDIFAVGGPGYENGSGRVVVYQRSSELERATSDYTILGEPIIGQPGDRLGVDGAITGGMHGENEELIVIVATATGTVETYSLDTLANKWKPHIESLSTGKNGMVLVEYSSSAGLITGYPENDEVSYYKTEVVINVTTDTPVPVISPVVTTVPVSAPVLTPVSAEAPTTVQTTAPNVVSTTSQPSVGTTVATASPGNTTTNGWVLVAESFSPQVEDGSGYGSAVAITDRTLVVGASMTLGNGAVFLYTKNTSSSSWMTEATEQLFGVSDGTEYGAAVDLSHDDAFLVVGAPRTINDNTLTEFGAVYCYSRVADSGKYEIFGDVIRGENDVVSASEMFGYSVAVASTSVTGRIAIGAPYNNLDMVFLRGKVYLYDYNISSSSWERIASFQGLSANSTFGTSMDMSKDGTQLIVGAPGTNYAEVYLSDGTPQWQLDYVINSSATDGTIGFGTLVVIITNNVFAVSDPNFNSGQGRVVIYQKDSTNAYAPFEIIGTVAGSQFGTLMTGFVDPSTSIPSIMIGSTDGSIARYDYDSSSSTWVRHATTLTSTSFGTDIIAIASSSGSVNEMAVIGTQNAAIYQWS